MDFKRFKEIIANIDGLDDCEVYIPHNASTIDLLSKDGDTILTINILEETLTYKL